jgi:hypothetical protein
MKISLAARTASTLQRPGRQEHSSTDDSWDFVPCVTHPIPTQILATALVMLVSCNTANAASKLDIAYPLSIIIR